MSFIFDPLWESSDEDDIANDVYEDIIMVKIKEIGLMPRWLAVEEKMPITGWMMENEDEMDFQHTLKQQPLERLKELWHYMLEDLGIRSVNQDLPEPVKNKLMSVIKQGVQGKTQVDYRWERTDMGFGRYIESSKLREVLTTLRADELKHAHIFTPPSPPPKNNLKAQVDYLWDNTQSFGTGKKLPERPKNGSSGDRASWLSLGDNQVKNGWEGEEIRSYSSMSFNRDFEWVTSDSNTTLIYQTFEDGATLHFRPKNTSNHVTKLTTVSSKDEVQIRRYFTHIPNQNQDEYLGTTITQFIKGISYAANVEVPEGNKDKPFTVDADIIKKFLDQDENTWIYDNWEEFFTEEWKQAAREAYKDMTPALLGLSIQPITRTTAAEDGFGDFSLDLVFNYHSWFNMKKSGGVYGKAQGSDLAIPVEFSLFHGYTTYAEQKHPRLRYYERGMGVLNWWW